MYTFFFKFVDRFPLTFSSSSYWSQFFNSLSLCSFPFAELFPVCHTGRDRCTLFFSSSSTDFHSPSQVRHTGRNSLTPFPFAPFLLLNFFLSVTLAATGVHFFFKFVDRCPLTFSSSSYWSQFFNSLSLCSFPFAELFPVCHTGRDRCTLFFSSSSTDFHSPSQVRHTGRNS